MNLFKRKKDEKEVQYEHLGENAYHIKAEIEGERFDIIAYGLPEEKKTDTKGAVEAGLTTAKVEGGQDKVVKSSWDAIVKTEKHGYLPYETWKKVAEQVPTAVSSTISVATGSTVNSTDINVYASAPIFDMLKCKKCGQGFFIEPANGKCPRCGESIE
jgi:rubrerythrin